MLHPGARVLNQWNRRHASLQEGFLVGEARRLLDPVVASQVEDRLAAMHGAFEKLSSIRSSLGRTPVERKSTSIRSSLPPRDRARAQRILAGRLLSDAEYVVTLAVRYANGGKHGPWRSSRRCGSISLLPALFLGAYHDDARRPLFALGRDISRIGQGDFQTPFATVANNEIGDLVQQIE